MGFPIRIYNQAHPLKTNNESLYLVGCKNTHVSSFQIWIGNNVTFPKTPTPKRAQQKTGKLRSIFFTDKGASGYDLRVPSVHGLQIYYLGALQKTHQDARQELLWPSHRWVMSPLFVYRLFKKHYIWMSLGKSFPQHGHEQTHLCLETLPLVIIIQCAVYCPPGDVLYTFLSIRVIFKSYL